MANKKWILTIQYNDYDQHGEYFVAWFGNKPQRQQIFNILYKYFDSDKTYQIEALAEHIIENGGGRIAKEYVWFYLREEQEGIDCHNEDRY